MVRRALLLVLPLLRAALPSLALVVATWTGVPLAELCQLGEAVAGEGGVEAPARSQEAEGETRARRAPPSPVEGRQGAPRLQESPRGRVTKPLRAREWSPFGVKTNGTPPPSALALLLRAALALAVDPIAAATGLPSPVVAQLAALAVEAFAALPLPKASDDAPRQLPAPPRGRPRPRRRRRRARGRRRGR